jgi:hypothetical protein
MILSTSKIEARVGSARRVIREKIPMRAQRIIKSNKVKKNRGKAG